MTPHSAFRIPHSSLIPTSLALRESRGQWVLPDVLARRLGLDAAGLRAALRELREAGFQIEVRPGGALRLIAGPDRLDPRELVHGLDTQVVGRRVIVHAETTSTNDLVWASLEAGEPEGVCFFAEYQTGGRGRQGRRWIAPPGTAILMSVGFKKVRGRRSEVGGARKRVSDLRPLASDLLMFAASVATAEAIRSAAGVPCAIEWPNDVTCRDLKVAGILVERRMRNAECGMRNQGSGFGDRDLGPRPAPPRLGNPNPKPGTGLPDSAFRIPHSAFSVVGVGINANVPLSALPPDVRPTATSLAAEAGGPIDRVLLARQLIGALDTWYGVIASGDSALVQERWRELSATVGRRMRILQDGRTFEGEVVDVSAADGLALRLDYGEIRRVRPESATVLVRWPR